MMSSSIYGESKLHSVTPEQGFVPNVNTAINIAEAIWLPIYGESIYSKGYAVTEVELKSLIEHGTAIKLGP